MPPGRPPADRQTKQMRVFDDTGDMLAWILRIKGGSSAEYIEHRIRADVERDFESIRPLVEQIEAAKRKPDPDTDPAFAVELGEAGA